MPGTRPIGTVTKRRMAKRRIKREDIVSISQSSVDIINVVLLYSLVRSGPLLGVERATHCTICSSRSIVSRLARFAICPSEKNNCLKLKGFLLVLTRT